MVPESPQSDSLHISSVLVTAYLAAVPALAAKIGAMRGTEVHAVAGSKIVVVLEGRDSREIGDHLAEIAHMEGVLAANMVFEQVVDSAALEKEVGDTL